MVVLIAADNCRFWVRRLVDLVQNRDLCLLAEVVPSKVGQPAFLRAVRPGSAPEELIASKCGAVLISHKQALDHEAMFAQMRRTNPSIRLRRAHRNASESDRAVWLLQELARAGVILPEDVGAFVRPLRELETGAARDWTVDQTRTEILAEIWAQTANLDKPVPDRRAAGAFKGFEVADLPGARQWLYTGIGPFSQAQEGLCLIERTNPGEDPPKMASLAAHGHFPTEDGKLANLSGIAVEFGEAPLKSRHTALAVLTIRDGEDDQFLVSAPIGRGAAIDALVAQVARIPKVSVARGEILGRSWCELTVPQDARDRIKALVTQQFALASINPASAGLSLFIPVRYARGAHPQELRSRSPAEHWRYQPAYLGAWPDTPDDLKPEKLRNTLEHYFHKDIWNLLGISGTGSEPRTPKHPEHSYRLGAAECVVTDRPGTIVLNDPRNCTPLKAQISRLLVHSISGRSALVELVLSGLSGMTTGQYAEFCRYARMIDEAFEHKVTLPDGQEKPIKLDVRLPGQDEALRILGPEEPDGPQKRSLFDALRAAIQTEMEPLADDRAFLFHSAVIGAASPPPDSPAGRELAVLLQRLNTVDGFGTQPFYGEPAAAREYRESCYDRFAGFGTHFMAVDHAFGLFALSDETDQQMNFALRHIHHNHMANHYHLMVVYAQLVRAELRVMAQRLSKAAKDRRTGKDASKRIRCIRKDFTTFVSTAWHADVSPQLQGQELFDLIARRLGIGKQIKALDRAVAIQEHLEAEEREAAREGTRKARVRRENLFAWGLSVAAIALALASLVDSPLGGRLGLKALIEMMPDGDTGLEIALNAGLVLGFVGLLGVVLMALITCLSRLFGRPED